MSSLLLGAIGGAIAVCVSGQSKELKVKTGCAYVIDKISRFSDFLRPAAVRSAKGVLVVKERIMSDIGTLREELDDVMKEAGEADQKEEGSEAAPNKKEQLRSQFMSDIGTLREELDDIMKEAREAQKEKKEKAARPNEEQPTSQFMSDLEALKGELKDVVKEAREADQKEESARAARPKEEQVPVREERPVIKERIKSDLGTVRGELREIMKEAREAQKEESARAASPDDIDDRLKEVERYLETLDKKTKKKPIKKSTRRKPSKKPGAAR